MSVSPGVIDADRRNDHSFVNNLPVDSTPNDHLGEFHNSQYGKKGNVLISKKYYKERNPQKFRVAREKWRPSFLKMSSSFP